MTKKTIRFNLIENDLNQGIETYSGEYRSLMMLIKDKTYLDLFGECGGMGRCATCIIKINGLKGDSKTKERNEPATLSKFGYEAEDIRLSCQILVTADLDDATIEISE